MRLTTSPLALLALLPVASSFVTPNLAAHHHADSCHFSQHETSDSPLTEHNDDNSNPQEDTAWYEWANEHGIQAPKLDVRLPFAEERGKGGVHAKQDIAALEVLMRVPRGLVLAACDLPPRAAEAASNAKEFSWAVDLTAAALAALSPQSEDGNDNNNNEQHLVGKQSWITSWKTGGWATDGADLGPPDVQWGQKSVTGSLLATGSDNDANVYSKFNFPCHPVVHRASLGLALLTGGTDDGDFAREALQCRGRTYRSLRDALVPLVETTPIFAERSSGSQRERRAWDIADLLSRLAARATTMELPLGSNNNEDENDTTAPTVCVVPLHERLLHCVEKAENSKLVANGEEVLLLATRDIQAGEAITRDYSKAPQLEGDTSDGALRLLLQFGLPPKAWPKK
jgi:hypothetical protein